MFELTESFELGVPTQIDPGNYDSRLAEPHYERGIKGEGLFDLFTYIVI